VVRDAAAIEEFNPRLYQVIRVRLGLISILISILSIQTNIQMLALVVKGITSVETQMHLSMRSCKETLLLFGVIQQIAGKDGKNVNQYPMMQTLREQVEIKHFISQTVKNNLRKVVSKMSHM